MKTLKQLSEGIMFSRVSTSQMLESFEYKKGKTIEDVRKAVKKGLKNGRQKTEIELEEIEHELGKVLIVRKVVVDEI